MSKTLVDLDEDLLTQAQHILGTVTKKATVNGALREVVRRAAAVRFLDQASAGVFGASRSANASPEHGSRS
jgi:Arc/MetJ family transcription regulator